MRRLETRVCGILHRNRLAGQGSKHCCNPQACHNTTRQLRSVEQNTSGEKPRRQFSIFPTWHWIGGAGFCIKLGNVNVIPIFRIYEAGLDQSPNYAGRCRFDFDRFNCDSVSVPIDNSNIEIGQSARIGRDRNSRRGISHNEFRLSARVGCLLSKEANSQSSGRSSRPSARCADPFPNAMFLSRNTPSRMGQREVCTEQENKSSEKPGKCQHYKIARTHLSHARLHSTASDTVARWA